MDFVFVLIFISVDCIYVYHHKFEPNLMKFLAFVTLFYQ